MSVISRGIVMIINAINIDQLMVDSPSLVQNSLYLNYQWLKDPISTTDCFNIIDFSETVVHYKWRDKG